MHGTEVGVATHGQQGENPWGNGNILFGYTSVHRLVVLQDVTMGDNGCVGSLYIISYNCMPICNYHKISSVINESPVYKGQEDHH